MKILLGLLGCILASMLAARAATKAVEPTGDWFCEARATWLRVNAEGGVTLRMLLGDTRLEESAMRRDATEGGFRWEGDGFALEARLGDGELKCLRTNAKTGALEPFVCRRLDRERDAAIFAQFEPPPTPAAAGIPPTPRAVSAPSKPAIVPPRPDGAYEPEQLALMPQPVRQVAPLYPPSLWRKGISGEVLVDFLVTPDGRVAQAQAVRSTHKEFALAAVKAVSAWVFTPGMREGRAVTTHMQVPIVFGIEKR